MDESLRLEIEGLRKLKTKALKARYREVFGETSPSSNDADVRLRAPHQFWGKLQRAREEASVRRDRRLPAAGSMLKRSYRGQAIVVKVLDDGFEYNGQRHQSLSAIASQVTGTRWNGFAFFGLLNQARA